MISRTAALGFLVCDWCAAQATQDMPQLDRRLGLVEMERSQGHLTVAESILADVQAEIEKTEGAGIRLAAALREHGLLRDDEGRSAEALPFYERSLALFRALPDTSPISIGLLLGNLAGTHADLGDFDAALTLSTEAMTLLRSAGKPAQPELAVALYAHGKGLHGQGQNIEALHDLRAALEIWLRLFPADHPQVALVKEAIGTCLGGLGYHKQGEAALREALAIRQKVFGSDSQAVGESLNNLGVLLTNQQRFSEARQALARAAQIFEQFGDNELHRLKIVLGNLAGLYYTEAWNNSRLFARAEELYRRKLGIEEQIYGTSDVRISATLEMLGETLFRERAYNEAGRFYGRAVALQKAALGPDDPKTLAAAKRYNVMAKKMKVTAAR